MDLTATILHATGQGDHAGGLDGIDLMPALSGSAEMPERALFWQAELYDFGKQRAIRKGRYKQTIFATASFS